MLNKPFPDVLKQFSIDYSKEYEKLKQLFFFESSFNPKAFSTIKNTTLYACCDAHFLGYPYRRTILSLKEFNATFGFNFTQRYCEDMDDLIALCEYVYNLLYYIEIYNEADALKHFVLEHIESLCKEIHCSLNTDEDGIFFIVKEDALLESLCSVLDEPISIQMLKYTHHSLKGDLSQKSQILSAMAKELEGVREDSQYHYSSLFFYYANNCHVRHYNLKGNKKKGFVSKMNNDELEELYDMIFKIGVIAFAEHCNQDDIQYLYDNKDLINRKEDGTL